MPEFNIGDIAIRVIKDGRFWVDGGTMFGIVPRVMWAKLIQADELNRVPLDLNLVVVELDDRKILIDMGLGTKLREKIKQIYKVEDVRGVAPRLREAGIDPAGIDTVIFTHLHFDHCGGATESAGGAVRPVLPRAKYIIQRGEWDDAVNTDGFTRGGYVDRTFLELEKTGRLELIDGESEIAPGVVCRIARGHTRCHQVVLFESRGERGIHFGDLIPTAVNIKPVCISALDCFPQDTLAEKKLYLERAGSEGWQVVFGHDCENPLMRLGDS